MIRTKLRVEEYDIQRHGENNAFLQALADWEILPWVQYLREHGKIVKVDSYIEADRFARSYVLNWELPAEHETYFYLLYNERE